MSERAGSGSKGIYWSPTRKLLACGILVLAVPLGVVGGHAMRVGYLSRSLRDDVRAEMIRSIPSDKPLAQLFDLEDLRIPIEQILPGGPPKDGIPALTRPRTVRARAADFLAADDRVIGVEIDGVARAYPVRLLNHHEAVNDVVGGVPIAVVFCPLCDSATVVDRRIDGQTLEFGISGLLHNSNVLFYDRTHQALWSQVGLEAISGPYAGRSLRHLHDWQLTSFADWREQHPRSAVASFQTGHQRSYDRNPYAGYLAHDKLMFPVPGLDRQLPPKTPVIGVRIGDTTRAYVVDRLRERLEDEVGGARIVLERDAERGRVGVVEAPASAQVVHTFWFTWSAFHPDTEIHGGGEEGEDGEDGSGATVRAP
jgi:hypothetical protein